MTQARGPSRRDFLAGLGAAAAGWALLGGRRADAAGGGGTGGSGGRGGSGVGPRPDPSDGPILSLSSLGESVAFGGIPFSAGWWGDWFGPSNLPFHSCEDCDRLPEPDEQVDVAIVGGGLSGLATAYHLRERNPVLFELRRRMGGNASGERWRGIPYSLGSAYFMVPDRGDDFDRLYAELGVYEDARIDTAATTYEYGGRVMQALCDGCTPAEQAAVEAYLAEVQRRAFSAYPDIPFPEGDPRILELDARSFHDDVRKVCGGSIPAMLARTLQAYCYSSLGVGWDELSAAAAWNFVAAEEYGRIVLPGGNASLAERLWQRLRGGGEGGTAAGATLRAGATVVRVETRGRGAVVWWRTPAGQLRGTLANHVVMAGSKHVVKHVLPQLASLDNAKLEAMNAAPTVAYLVANVLLRRPARDPWYDVFLLHDAAFPMDGGAFSNDRRIVDAVGGTWAHPSRGAAGDVLTCYWPLPWHHARFTIVGDLDWQTYAKIAAPQVARMVELFGLAPQDVEQVRLARWGHAMPYAVPGAYASGICERLRRPLEGRIWFANQDNWLLPAVETCLGEARQVAHDILASL